MLGLRDWSVFRSVEAFVFNLTSSVIELLQEDPSEVFPLPEEMIKSLPVVMLSSGGNDSSPSEVKNKKDRRRLRHERWLKSKNHSSALITVWWPNQLTCMILPWQKCEWIGYVANIHCVLIIFIVE